MKNLILFGALVMLSFTCYAQNALTLGRGLTGNSYNTTSSVTTTLDTNISYTWLKEQLFNRGSLGTTTTNGISLISTAAAANNAQQISPALHFLTHGWSTASGGSSQSAEFYFQVLPFQGTSLQANLQLLTSINGSTPSANFTFGSGGAFMTGNVMATGSNIGVTSADGIAISNASAATSSLNQWSRRVRWTGNAWNTSTLASNEADWIAEMKTLSGNPITTRLAFSSRINNGTYTERFGMADSGLFYFNSAAMTGNQLVGANSGATGMEAKTLNGSSTTGLTVTNDTGTITFSNDTTALQTVVNFFPKGDTRYLKTTTAAATYQPLLGYTAANNADVVHLTGNENISGTKTFAGSLAIGTTSVPSGYKFAINGNTIATAVTVMAESNWPDYVFNGQYQLRPIGELQDYIKINHRLPDVPSAEQVAKNGQNLGEMNTILLRKVEELTMYMIEQQKEIDNLKKAISVLNNSK